MHLIYWLGKRAIEEIVDNSKRTISFSPVLRERLGHHIHGEAWATTIKETLQKHELINRPIHIISANLHSVMNTLHAPKALKDLCAKHDIFTVYELLSKEENKVLRNKTKQVALHEGMIVLEDTSGTNIDVQIFDASKIDFSNTAFEFDTTKDAPVIIVMDYAFGEQAYETIDELLKPFKTDENNIHLNVDSISIMGKAGIQVIVVDDSKDFDTPDSIFPNNWISFHENGTIGLYPMFAENRRLERKDSILEAVEAEGFNIETVVDYTEAESDGYYLEGTGSILLDRENQKAYCALSARADEELFIEFCEDFEYTPVLFSAYQTVNDTREKIYHTNVMMCLGTTFAVVCLASIDDKKERKNLLKHLHEDGKKVIEISEDQVNNFAGNMLQLKGDEDRSYLVMSQSAYDSLRPAQVQLLEAHATIISSSLDTIEACGGGSARCMMAEVFLPKTDLK